MIYTLVAAGIDYQLARNMPVDQANEILSCHWQSQGFSVERMACQNHGIDLAFDPVERFNEILNREKSWPLEQL